MKKNPLIAFLLDLLETLAISLAIFLVIYIFFLQPHQVDGHSMDTTLENGEYILTDKISYRFSDPQRGDIIVFHAPKIACYSFSKCDFVKRIIGLPGETVTLQDNHFYINGELLAEPYLASDTITTANNSTDALYNGQAIVLASDEYLVAGDNRGSSYDSRSWGPITRSAIIGKAFFSYWPTETFGLIETN